MSENRRIHWAGLMKAGLGQLGLAPDVFWALTPYELMVMLGLEGGPKPLTRQGLDALIAAFPDDEKGTEE